MREKIAEIVDLKSIVSFDSKKREGQKEDNLDLTDQVLSLIREEIEKVENPYPHFHGESLVHGSSSEVFEECRQKILALLKPDKPTQEIINPDNSEKLPPKQGCQTTGV